MLHITVTHEFLPCENKSTWTSPALLDDYQVPICSFSNYIEARDHIHAEHDRNRQLMAAKPKQATKTPFPTPTNFTNTTKPMVAMSTTLDDDSDAPF